MTVPGALVFGMGAEGRTGSPRPGPLLGGVADTIAGRLRDGINEIETVPTA